MRIRLTAVLEYEARDEYYPKDESAAQRVDRCLVRAKKSINWRAINPGDTLTIEGDIVDG